MRRLDALMLGALAGSAWHVRRLTVAVVQHEGELRQLRRDYRHTLSRVRRLEGSR